MVEDLRRRFGVITNPAYVAVLLFGSWARCETIDRSDLDLLVLHKLGISDLVIRRRVAYLVASALLRDYEALTVLDMPYESFIRPRVVTPLLLNICWDSVVIMDRTNRLNDFLRFVRQRIVDSGLRRVKDGRAYYWILPKPMARVKLL